MIVPGSDVATVGSHYDEVCMPTVNG